MTTAVPQNPPEYAVLWTGVLEETAGSVRIFEILQAPMAGYPPRPWSPGESVHSPFRSP